MTMMDTFRKEIIASCDLEFGLLCKLNVILIRFCMIYAYTRPIYQVSVYRTIGPLVCLP